MYGIFTYIYHKYRLNVSKYSINWAYGYVCIMNYDILDTFSLAVPKCRAKGRLHLGVATSTNFPWIFLENHSGVVSEK